MNDLLNPDYLEDTIDALNRYAINGEVFDQRFIDEYLIELESFMAIDDPERSEDVIKSSEAFYEALREVSDYAKDYGIGEHAVESLKVAWSRFQGWISLERNFDFNRQRPAAELGKKFDNGRKKERSDALSRVMNTAMLDFIKENGKAPTWRQLWALIPVGGCIQEKDSDTPDDWLIYWRDSKGVDRPPCNIQLFKDRYTTLRKKIKKK